MKNILTLTVSQLNEYMKALLDSNELLNDLYIQGEISNFTHHYKSGHLYFSLKDSGGVLKAVMFRSSAVRLRFMPEDGMKVLVRGRISVFPRDGVYQLYAEEIQPDGLGSLYLAFEQLKNKLFAEGLFDEAHKKPIPPYPSKIGIITADTGAAVADMKKHSFASFSVRFDHDFSLARTGRGGGKGALPRGTLFQSSLSRRHDHHRAGRRFDGGSLGF